MFAAITQEFSKNLLKIKRLIPLVLVLLSRNCSLKKSFNVNVN